MTTYPKARLAKIAAVMVGALALALSPALAASAASYSVSAVSPGVGSSTSSTISVATGDTVTVNGSGFLAGSTIFVAVCDTATLGTSCDAATAVNVIASATGTFSTTVPVSGTFASSDPHGGGSGETVTCATAGSTDCGILIVQHAGFFPYVIQPLQF